MYDIQELSNPTDKRIFAVAAALGDPERWSLRKLYQLTRIDPWFLSCMNNIVSMATRLCQLECNVGTLDLITWLEISLSPSPRALRGASCWKRSSWDSLTDT